jgi:hypothetical protein
MLFQKITTLLLLSGIAFYSSAQESVTYSVITALPKPNMSVKVVIDNKSFPLKADESSILFRGKAPKAHFSYHYAIFGDQDDNDRPTLFEAFSREPVSESTVNEFFNRSKNTHKLAPLPQVYQPLPVINRIKSDLHTEGEIPTIHLWGDQSEIDRLHDNQSEDIKIKLNMDYIG